MAIRLDEMIKKHRGFIGDASHQLRTPLTGLQLRLENLESDLRNPTQKADVALAIAETNRLARIVADLLELARAERDPEVETIDVVSLVDARVDIWNSSASPGDPQITLVTDTSTMFATAITGALEQILDNLLDNAVAVAPPGTAVEVALTSNSDQVLICVADRGPGLDRDSKERALERFWRGDNSKHGTGLGLAVVKTLAEASGGSVSLEDRQGAGLAVTVTLRAAS